MVYVDVFDSKLLKIDKKLYKNIGIYNIGYITIKKNDDCENIYSVNPLYLIIGEVDGHIAEINGSKKMEVWFYRQKQRSIRKMHRTLDGIKNEVETINGGKKFEYSKDFMKIKFDSVDDLSLDKPLTLLILAVIVRSVFEENGKFYPQDYLDGSLYEL